jgi:hypothetical protein
MYVFCIPVIFTSIVFLVYDAVIEKRQRKVMLSATRSSAIISSLFPSKVRNRLYEETAPAQRLPEKESQTNRMKHFMAKTQRSVEPINTGPIADLFESTTVLFADIKGFTKWYAYCCCCCCVCVCGLCVSFFQYHFLMTYYFFLLPHYDRSSSREPTAVFTLLETLYGVYDKLAEKWGVYKVRQSNGKFGGIWSIVYSNFCSWLVYIYIHRLKPLETRTWQYPFLGA